MREPSDAVIDRLGDDVARLEAEADAVWAVLDAAGIDVQLGTDTLADGVQKVVRQRDQLIKDRDAPAMAARRARVDRVGYFLADLDDSDV